MKFLGTAACILAYASSLAAAEVTFVVSLKPLPGKAHAAAQFLAKTIDSFTKSSPRASSTFLLLKTSMGDWLVLKGTKA
ncbi:hypothetical protein BDW75DRAFT_244982 [Aspergillus navahoensis]